MPHLDQADIVIRKHVADLSREARIRADQAENGARIREQIEREAPAHVTDEDAAEQRRFELEDEMRDKLSSEELYPEHFPESTHEQEEV
jgi:hypothetical protein